MYKEVFIDEYYTDADLVLRDRCRVGEKAWYDDLVVSSLHRIFGQIQKMNKHVTFVANPARFALEYQNEAERTHFLIQMG